MTILTLSGENNPVHDQEQGSVRGCNVTTCDDNKLQAVVFHLLPQKPVLYHQQLCVAKQSHPGVPDPPNYIYRQVFPWKAAYQTKAVWWRNRKETLVAVAWRGEQDCHNVFWGDINGINECTESLRRGDLAGGPTLRSPRVTIRN